MLRNCWPACEAATRKSPSGTNSGRALGKAGVEWGADVCFFLLPLLYINGVGCVLSQTARRLSPWESKECPEFLGSISLEVGLPVVVVKHLFWYPLKVKVKNYFFYANPWITNICLCLESPCNWGGQQLLSSYTWLPWHSKHPCRKTCALYFPHDFFLQNLLTLFHFWSFNWWKPLIIDSP